MYSKHTFTKVAELNKRIRDKNLQKSKNADETESSSDESSEDGEYNPLKSPDPFKKALYKRRKDDYVEVKIGKDIYDCHMQILAANSDYFKSKRTEKLIVLPKDKIRSNTFQIIYTWMEHLKPVSWDDDQLPYIFIAANFLVMRQLYKLCLSRIVNSGNPLFIKSLHYTLSNEEQLKLADNCHLFLNLETNKKSAKLPLKDITKSIDAEEFGVTTELEKFMFITNWLAHDWKNREKHLPTLLTRVNFNELPSWLLAIKSRSICPQIRYVLNHDSIKERIKVTKNFKVFQLVPPSKRCEVLEQITSDSDICE